MKISTRGRYATRAMTDLALHSSREPVLLKDISRRQGISLAYLEQIVAPLIAAGIIRSTRGPKGGFRLAKTPDEISVMDIVQAVEGTIAPVGCVEDPNRCTRIKTCAAHDVWMDVSMAVKGVLESTTLQEVVERQKIKAAGKGRQFK